MENKVIVLGSGTTAILPDKGCPGFLLFLGGKKMLLDLGSDTLYRYAKLGYKIDEIDILAITRDHPGT
ncbi:MAG: hypothetical protein ACQEP2_08100 [Actinomycetota bacterium]